MVCVLEIKIAGDASGFDFWAAMLYHGVANGRMWPCIGGNGDSQVLHSTI